MCTQRTALSGLVSGLSAATKLMYIYVKTLFNHLLMLQPTDVGLNFSFSGSCSSLSCLTLFQSGLITCKDLLSQICIQVVLLSSHLRADLQTLYHLDPSLSSDWVLILSHHALAFSGFYFQLTLT